VRDQVSHFAFYTQIIIIVLYFEDICQHSRPHLRWI
jgi:hypothetical protein